MVVLDVGMAPRNVTTEELPSTEEGDALGLDQVPSVAIQQTLEQKPTPLKIVWKNVVIQILLHIGAIYGLTRIPSSHPLTWLWSKYHSYHGYIKYFFIRSIYKYVIFRLDLLKHLKSTFFRAKRGNDA